MKNRRNRSFILFLICIFGGAFLMSGCALMQESPEMGQLTAIKKPQTALTTQTPTETTDFPIQTPTTPPDSTVSTTAPTTISTTAPTTVPPTLPPTIPTRNIRVEAGKKSLSAADYFPDEPDISEEDVKIEPDLTKAQLADAGASYTVNVRCREIEFRFIVEIVDTTPPEIEVQDIYVEVGGTVSYKKYATVTDNSSNEVSLKIDNSKVDLDKVGSYIVTYTATDSSGNSLSAQGKVVVSEAKPISMEDVKPLIEAVVAKVVTPDMSAWDTAYALWNWCRTNIRYSYDHYDPSNIYAGAYDGLHNKKGDCFVYFATYALLLDEVGIENMRVSRVGGETNHYWNLVNVGDGWYHCDSSPRKAGHTYRCFMQTDEQIAWYTEYYKEKPNYYTFDPDLYPPRETKIVYEHY